MRPYKQMRLTASALALVAGGMIYILGRPRTLLLFWVADRIGLRRAFNTLRATHPLEEWPEWAVYSLPGGLWSLSYLLLADVLCSRLSTAMRVSLAGVIPFLGALSEVFQRFGWLPGTYDQTDLLFYLTPYLIYLCIHLSYPTYKKT